MPVRVGLPGFRVSLLQPPSTCRLRHETASCPDVFNLKIDGSLEHFSNGRSNAKPTPFWRGGTSRRWEGWVDDEIWFGPPRSQPIPRRAAPTARRPPFGD